MITYEYQCISCGKRFDFKSHCNQRNEPKPCPSCDGTGLKIMSYSTVHFRGEGFPGNDWRKKRND